MNIKFMASKTITRYFRAFDKQSFVKRGLERARLIDDVRTNDKETILSRLSAEQKEYVDAIFETYFHYLPKHLQDKFYLFCLNEELKVHSPEEVLFDSLSADAKDYEVIQNPVEEYYTVNKEFNKLMAESTKNIDLSKLSQGITEKPVEEAPKVIEQEDISKKRFKVEVVGIDAAKKLNIIKEIKAMLNVGLKEVR